MTSQPAEPLSKVCYPCTHFEQGAFTSEGDVLSRRILHYPLTGEDVRDTGAQMVREAAPKARSPFLIVHVEKGRRMCRLSVTGAYH